MEVWLASKTSGLCAYGVRFLRSVFMSLECSECERDLRGGHGPGCSRYKGEPPECTCTFRLVGMDDEQHQERCVVSLWAGNQRLILPEKKL